MNKIRRKLYRRGGSFETTIPMPLLFGLDEKSKYDVVFTFKNRKWYIEFEKRK